MLGWFTPAVGNQPCVVRVDTATSFPALGTGVTLPAGKVGMMPDSLGKFAAVKWTAPQNGQYAIDAQFTGRSTVEVGNSDVMVLRNGLQLFFSTIRDPRQIVLFQTVFDLTAGETMEFRVGKSNDTNANDLKQFDLVIQRLPRLCPGNINGDLQVDTADLVLLLAQFGQFVVPSEGGDLNGDGFVDTSDMQILLSNLGCQVCPVGRSVQGVHEQDAKVLRLEPRGFWRHDLTHVGYGKKVVHRRGEHRKSDRSLTFIDHSLQFRRASSTADKCYPLVGSRVADA